MRMTGDYASAMVTVLPIVMLIGAVEAKAWSQRLDTHLQRNADAAWERVQGGTGHSAPDSRLIRLYLGGRRPRDVVVAYGMVVAWFSIGLLHLLAEVRLMLWLASDTQSADPGLANFVFKVATCGFAVALGSSVGRLLLPSPDVRATWEQLSSHQARHNGAVDSENADAV
ncbi:hypothetical protein [Streptomyces chartreusis]